jgi:flagellar protein FlbT
MHISLRRGEKIYINGAVIRVDRKVCVELLNDVTFLLEHHVMQANDADTPLKQIYFVVQMMLMCPNDTVAASELFRTMHDSCLKAIKDTHIRRELDTVERFVKEKRNFDALKTLRALFPIEQEILSAGAARVVIQNAGKDEHGHAA